MTDKMINGEHSLTKQLLLSSNYWVLNKTVVKLLGIETAFLLSNFAEAEQMMSDKEGWFYQTSDTVEEMTTLSRHKQDQCIKQLEEMNILLKDVRGMPAKRYFKINYQCLTNLIVKNQQTSMRNIDKQDCKKSTTNKESINKESINKESINNVLSEPSSDDYKFDENSIEYKTAFAITTIILKNKSNANINHINKSLYRDTNHIEINLSKIQSWCKDIDKMIRLDDKTPREIVDLFQWAQHNSFWQANILSPSKLRAKWDTLEIQKNNKKNNKQSKDDFYQMLDEWANESEIIEV